LASLPAKLEEDTDDSAPDSSDGEQELWFGGLEDFGFCPNIRFEEHQDKIEVEAT
jgi:hypothetical protein|tara:strand:- start:971 stop:1135 length:165 start_codon:yes stop_codon:yes gene_type:complete